MDSDSSAYICTSIQDLIENRRLKKDDMILQIDNGAKIIAEVMILFRLSSKFRLDLKDCYFISVASQNLISVSMLAQDGFKFNFNKNFYSIYLWNKLVARDLLIDSLYHLHTDANVNLNKQIVNIIGQKRSRDKIN